MLSDELSPKTFDLIGVLSGRDLPTLDVEVYFNEELGFTINFLRKSLRNLEILGKTEEAREVSDRLEELLKQTPEHKYVVVLKSVPERVIRAERKKHLEEFPQRKTALGIPEQDDASDEAFLLRLWGIYIQAVKSPDGSVVVPTEDDIKALYEDAPRTVQNKITDGIKELQEGSDKGFEYAAQEADFLSHASPEG